MYGDTLPLFGGPPEPDRPAHAKPARPGYPAAWGGPPHPTYGGLMYRYTLWRLWDGEMPYLQVIGLNPSTADERTDDPTLRRCIGFARKWGFGALCMTNVFAYRSTQPGDLLAADDPDGPDNARWLTAVAGGAGLILAAWSGFPSARMDRPDLRIVELLPVDKLVVLGRTKDGYPRHPLYMKADTLPQPWSLG